MVAKTRLLESNERGQSIMEFVMMLPILIGMTVILIKINTAIQVSIVSQQYARSQALFLAYNSPFYPERTKQAVQVERGMNQLVVGVSGNVIAQDETEPEATTQNVTRQPKPSGPDNEKEEPNLRAKVRIRDTVTLCTQNVLLGVGGKSGGKPVLSNLGVSIMNEGVSLASYCGSGLKYE